MTRLRCATAGIALPLLLACQTLVPPPSADPPAALAEEVLEPATAVIPDLTGTWSARLRSIYRGVGALALGASEGADIDYLRLTIDIEIQDGRLFYGTFHSQAPGAEDAPPKRSSARSVPMARPRSTSRPLAAGRCTSAPATRSRSAAAAATPM